MRFYFGYLDHVTDLPLTTTNHVKERPDHVLLGVQARRSERSLRDVVMQEARRMCDLRHGLQRRRVDQPAVLYLRRRRVRPRRLAAGVRCGACARR